MKQMPDPIRSVGGWRSSRLGPLFVAGLLASFAVGAVPAGGAGGVLTPVACDPATICQTGSDPDGVAVDPSGNHLYVANAESHSISVFSIGAGGVLAPVACDPNTSCLTGNGPVAVAVDPSGSHLYVTNFSADSISVFSIGAGGVLAPVPCDPTTICMTGADPDLPEYPGGVVIDPSGTHLYVNNVQGNSISVFSIGANGVPAPVACDPTTICKTGSAPVAIAIDPSGSHIYVTNALSNSISVFSIGANGVPAPVACDPTTSCQAGASPRAVAVDPSGSHLYVTNARGNSLSVFAIGANGSLAPVACDPTTICRTGSTPQMVAVDPSGSRLYVTNRLSSSLSVFSIGAGGVPAPLACQPNPTCETGSTPLGVAVDPSGSHVYVTNSVDRGSVSVFAIGAGGALAPAIGKVTISPSAFPAQSSGPSAQAAKKRKRADGAKVVYTLNVAASVRFTVQRRSAGRKAEQARKTTCDRPTKGNSKRPKCTRYVTRKGSFTSAGMAGTNKFRFSGRLNGKRLPPGNYRLLATPTANMTTGRAATAKFRITP